MRAHSHSVESVNIVVVSKSLTQVQLAIASTHNESQKAVQDPFWRVIKIDYAFAVFFSRLSSQCTYCELGLPCHAVQMPPVCLRTMSYLCPEESFWPFHTLHTISSFFPANVHQALAATHTPLSTICASPHSLPSLQFQLVLLHQAQNALQTTR